MPRGASEKDAWSVGSLGAALVHCGPDLPRRVLPLAALGTHD
jgi:hypothetical protein